MVIRCSQKFRCEFLLTTLLITLSCAWSWSATFTVTTTADSGPGSLRQAIIDSNTNLGLDTIEFNIPVGQCQANGVCVITLATSLPDVTDGMTLDATTQPRFGTAPANVCATETAPSYLRVQLETTADYILNIESANLGTTFTVRGLAFAGQNVDAIRHHTYSRGLYQCNHFGLDGTGTVQLELGSGVCIHCYEVGGNAWIGTDGDGWYDVEERNVFGAGLGINVNAGSSVYPNWIAGNFFGLGADGFTQMNLSIGIYMRQNVSQTLIGTDEDGLADDIERNIFASCNTGVYLFTNSGAEYANFIVGNWIGCNSRGSAAGNTTGISLGGDSTQIEVSRNRIMGNQTGLSVQNSATIDLESGFNCVTGNLNGAIHGGVALGLELEQNWWGAANGPSGVGPGDGDSVSVTGAGSVDISPWLTSAPAACALIFTDGFETGNTAAW